MRVKDAIVKLSAISPNLEITNLSVNVIPNEDNHFGRQPERVVVTITGDERDVANLRPALMSYLSNRFASVDFGVISGQTQIFCHPFAVND